MGSWLVSENIALQVLIITLALHALLNMSSTPGSIFCDTDLQPMFLYDIHIYIYIYAWYMHSHALIRILRYLDPQAECVWLPTAV